MATKNVRADGTYIISTDSTDNPKLGAKILSDGRESLFLDFYLGFNMSISSKSGKEYKRVNNKREFLKLYLWQAPRTPIERLQNKETLELAKKIRFERGQQLLENAEGYRLKKERNINFLDYFRAYIAKYTKKDKRMIEMALRRFIDLREFGIRKNKKKTWKKLVISPVFCIFIVENQNITKSTGDDYQRQSYRDFLYYR